MRKTENKKHKETREEIRKVFEMKYNIKYLLQEERIRISEQENEKLKNQLAEKDNKIQVLEKQRNNYRHKRNKYRKQLKPIKKQLAEKEKEIDILKKDYEFVAKQYKELMQTGDFIIEQKDQDKISFAVGQLINLKNMLADRAELIECGSVAEFMFTVYDLEMCSKEIIKQLKEGK